MRHRIEHLPAKNSHLAKFSRLHLPRSSKRTMHSNGYSGSAYFRAGSVSREPSTSRKPVSAIGLSLPSYNSSRSHSLNNGSGYSSRGTAPTGSYSSLLGSSYSGYSSVGRSGSFDYGSGSSGAYARSSSATRSGYTVPSSYSASFSIPSVYSSSRTLAPPRIESSRGLNISPSASPRLPSSSLTSLRLSSRYSDYGSLTSLSDRASSRPSRPASTASSVAGDSVPPSRPTTPSPSGVAPSSEEIDYKKLYEEEKQENERLREQLQETRSELSEAKAKLERSVQVSNARTALSEVEKRERRALERKLSEMEEELKVLEQLKADNQRLRDENGALIRVISKLSK